MGKKTTSLNQFVANCQDIIRLIDEGLDWQSAMRVLLVLSFPSFSTRERAAARTALLNVFVHAFAHDFERRPPFQFLATPRVAASGSSELSESFSRLLETATADAGEHIEPLTRSGDNDPRLRPGLSYIRDRYADATLNLAETARQSNLSKWHFDRVLKDVTGATFREHLTAIRMMKAEELLETTRLEIKEIAGHVGYKHVSHFSRQFKSLHGMSATEYRRRCVLKKRNLG